MDWYLNVLKKYAEFGGRARRKEFWFFALFSAIIGTVLSMLDRLIGTDTSSGAGVLYGLYALAVLVPSIAVGVRRLHDTGRSGWWLLIVIVPIVGSIVMIVFAVQDGTVGPNEYGPDPKAAERTGGAPAYPPPA